VRVATLLLLLSGIAAVAAGCGGAGETSSSDAVRLQREDLVAVSRALTSAERSVATEVAAARTAWPLVASGLPADAAVVDRAPIDAARQSAAKIQTPALLGEAQAVSLTGPAAQLAGLFRSFSGLAALGWKLTGAAIDELQNGSATAARFARENVALYIESIYDGHFELAQLGKKLLDGYRALGGPRAFGSALSQREVDALALAYSETADRLHPHVGVRLGS
jgi:hypothetical protein